MAEHTGVCAAETVIKNLLACEYKNTMTINPSSLYTFRYVRYPISKEALLDVAEDVHAPWDVVEALESLPGSEYESFDGIVEDIHRI